VEFSVSGIIFHSDQGSQYGAEQARTALLRKGLVRSMSRAGTPTENGYAERFVGMFKLAVAERSSYRTLGEFLREAERWISNRLINMPEVMVYQQLLICPYFNVQFFGYLKTPIPQIESNVHQHMHSLSWKEEQDTIDVQFVQHIVLRSYIFPLLMYKFLE
jgi:transposase InsO family protein